MTKASRSRQLRRFTTTLAPVCINAMQIIRDEYHPDKPLTKAMAQGIINDAVLLWAEMVRQRQVKMKDQQSPNAEVQSLEGEQTRSGETTDGPTADASTDAGS